MLTMHVSTTSAERRFSTLEIIKIYLRMSMKQKRVTRLSMLSIEAVLGAIIDYKSLLENFKNLKVIAF